MSSLGGEVSGLGPLLARAQKDAARRKAWPSVDRLTGWRSVLYYLYYRNRYFFLREGGMWLFNLLEIGLAAWLLGGLQVRGLALAGRYVQLLVALWGGVTFAERILVGRYHASKQPERVARTVATFIQLGAGVGLVLAVLLNGLAPVLVVPTSGEDEWIVQLFRHRAILLVPELIAGSWFAGAYTMSRMYRPLSITFLVRLVAVLSNVFLYPRWGGAVLVVNLYLPRLVDLAVTIWVSRKWAFAPNRVPALPLMAPTAWDAGLLREMSPFVCGRGLGVLFREGYGVILLQAVSWLLPNEMIFYVFFLQVLSLLYLIPRRLGRSLFFDVNRLLIWNRLGVLKTYVRRIDRVALVTGVATAGMCLLLGLNLDRLAFFLAPERVLQVKPLIYATSLFLLFHPQNEVWQSLRDAAGELRFNNILLGITHYGIALPINLWLLAHVGGQLQEVESYGLDFVVVSHSLLFVRVLLVDGALEGVRAGLARLHGLRFRWAEESPLRVARSWMDSELAYARSHAVSMSFSRDLADLWEERFLGAVDAGLVSLPYWGTTVCRFWENEALRARGFGLIRLSTGRSRHSYWKPGQEGIPALLGRLRPVDGVCRVSATRLAIFLPGIEPAELKQRVFEISSTVGIHLVDLAFVHSGEGRIGSLDDIQRWMLTPDERRKKPCEGRGEVLSNVPDRAWEAVSELYSLQKGWNEEGQQFLVRLCNSWAEAESRGRTMEDWASQEGLQVLVELLGAEVEWSRPEQWESGDPAMQETLRILQRTVRGMDRHRVPEFRRFLKAEANRLLPVFYRSHLVGAFVHAPVDQAHQANLVRLAAAFHVWATWRSFRTFQWKGKDGTVLAPVFRAEREAARLLQKETRIPFSAWSVALVRRGDVPAQVQALGEAFGPEALISKRGRHLEVLIPGMDPVRAEERWRSSCACRMGLRGRRM